MLHTNLSGRRPVLRRRLTAAIGALAVLLPALTAATVAESSSSPVPAALAVPDPRPNIIVITTDDQRADETFVLTRLRERIAARGTSFAHAYANFPLCCPARATFQTGQYAHNHGVAGNLSPTSPVGGFPAFNVNNTVATWLDAAGYRTAFVGKYLNKYGVPRLTLPPGWDDWQSMFAGGNYFDTKIYDNGVKRRFTGPYQTDVLGNLATEVIQRDAPADPPFFLYASFYPPHNGTPAEPDDPRITTPAVAPRWRDFYAGRQFAKGPAYNEADVSDKPSYVRSKIRITANMEAQLTEASQQRLESLEAFDEAVGNMLDALTAAGELDNTVILFTSDNGYMRGEHRIHAGKTVPYEDSARVPLIASGPGFPAGVIRGQMVGHIDLAATIAFAAGVTPRLPVDGVPLQRVAETATAFGGRSQVLEAGPKTVDGPWFYRGVRHPRWEYIDYGTEDFVELYDMVNDPDQLRNLAYVPAFADERADMAALLAQLRDCSGAACRVVAGPIGNG